MTHGKVAKTHGKVALADRGLPSRTSSLTGTHHNLHMQGQQGETRETFTQRTHPHSTPRNKYSSNRNKEHAQ